MSVPIPLPLRPPGIAVVVEAERDVCDEAKSDLVDADEDIEDLNEGDPTEPLLLPIVPCENDEGGGGGG